MGTAAINRLMLLILIDEMGINNETIKIHYSNRIGIHFFNSL
jgi:hypothetical protein